ncbi:hypothetical protein ACJX0J_041260, partial [Zea mays]
MIVKERDRELCSNSKTTNISNYSNIKLPIHYQRYKSKDNKWYPFLALCFPLLSMINLLNFDEVSIIEGSEIIVFCNWNKIPHVVSLEKNQLILTGAIVSIYFSADKLMKHISFLHGPAVSCASKQGEYNQSLDKDTGKKLMDDGIKLISNLQERKVTIQENALLLGSKPHLTTVKRDILG